MKLAEYRSATARVSLLLVVDVTQASGMLRWPDDIVPPSAQGFDAVYLYLHPLEARRLVQRTLTRRADCETSDVRFNLR